MFHIIYTSSASRLLSSGELRAIHDDAVRGNQSHGLTGFLLYRGGNFMQILEGDEAKVRARFEKIQSDHRHKDIYVLKEGSTPQRLFERFAMGFVNMDEQAGLPKYGDVLHESLDSLRFRKDGRLALRLLESFAELSA